MILKKFLSAIALACALTMTNASAAELKVRVSGITASARDAGSIVHVYVFTSADGFPKEERAIAHVAHSAPADSLEFTIQVPEAAEYALMAYLDRNGDGKMNRFLGMIPQEPYALSRNPQVMGKPRFADAAVRPSSGELIVLNLRD